MVFENQILVDSYKLIYRFIYHSGKIWMNKAIQKRVRWLYHRYEMTREEIIEYVKWQFKRQRKHRKFKPDKSCLETYVLNFTYFALLEFVRQCKKHESGGEKEITFSELADSESIHRIGSSIESFERQGIEGLMDEDDPERIVIRKELMNLATDYFGDNDLAVILGIRSTRAEARRLGIKYDTYRKRLQRKLAKFRSILRNMGYDLYSFS